MATAEVTVERTGGFVSSLWWIVLLQGIAAIILGLLLITNPATTLETLIIFLGVWWLIGGVFDLVRLFVDRTQWGWKLASGIIGILAGLAIIRHPMWASVIVPASLVWLLGFGGIAIGIISIVMAFQGGGWGSAIMGVISIVFGVLLVGVSPVIAAQTVVLLAAIWALIGGVIAVVYAFRLRSAPI